MRRKMSFWANTLAGLALLAAVLAPLACAQDPDDLKRGVARISLINGEASVQRGDSGEWVAAAVNAPVLTGDRISTGQNSRMEIQFDSGNVLRVGGEADVSLSDLETNRYQMAVGHGTITYRVLRASNIDIEVDTPNVSVRPSKQGTYRISVGDDGNSEITSRAGDVEVFTPRGSQWVASGQTMIARGTASDPEFQIVQAVGLDDWDRWNDSRDRSLTASVSNQYVPPGVYGAEDLDPYGSWVSVPQYGNVWHPAVAADWAPYRAGRWVWIDWYGWTWVSYDPWGWAPYHYGRWFYEASYGWCWYPGAIGVRHYWSPALVAFFGFGGGGVGFGIGNVGWVPLAPYEVLHPWWGRAYYGRSTYINRSVNIVNVNVVNSYRNARINNGFTAVRGEDFRAGRFNNYVRASGDELRQASVARGPVPIAPERSNLRFSDRQTAFVPRTRASQPVFTHQQPAPAQRMPFTEQRRAFEQAGVAQPERAGGFGNSGVSGAGRNAPPAARFNDAPVRGGFQNQNQTMSPAQRGNDSGRWQRFGEPRTPQQAAPRSEDPGRRFGQAAPRAEDPGTSGGRGWNRFGNPSTGGRPEFQRPGGSNYQSQPRPSAPAERFDRPNRAEPLRIAPPMIHERPNGGGGYTAPRNEMRAPSGGGYAPRNEMRAPSGGGFSPRNEMRAPSGGGFGGGRPSGGGGFNSRPSGGGGNGGGPRGGGNNGGGGGRRSR